MKDWKCYYWDEEW